LDLPACSRLRPSQTVHCSHSSRRWPSRTDQRLYSRWCRHHSGLSAWSTHRWHNQPSPKSNLRRSRNTHRWPSHMDLQGHSSLRRQFHSLPGTRSLHRFRRARSHRWPCLFRSQSHRLPVSRRPRKSRCRSWPHQQSRRRSLRDNSSDFRHRHILYRRKSHSRPPHRSCLPEVEGALHPNRV